jgi:hypothetical protein
MNFLGSGGIGKSFGDAGGAAGAICCDFILLDLLELLEAEGGGGGGARALSVVGFVDVAQLNILVVVGPAHRS